jgi:hypothetical protein
MCSLCFCIHGGDCSISIAWPPPPGRAAVQTGSTKLLGDGALAPSSNIARSGKLRPGSEKAGLLSCYRGVPD